jgi:hypothetical protein
MKSAQKVFPLTLQPATGITPQSHRTDLTLSGKPSPVQTMRCKEHALLSDPEDRRQIIAHSSGAEISSPVNQGDSGGRSAFEDLQDLKHGSRVDQSIPWIGKCTDGQDCGVEDGVGRMEVILQRQSRQASGWSGGTACEPKHESTQALRPFPAAKHQRRDFFCHPTGSAGPRPTRPENTTLLRRG